MRQLIKALIVVLVVTGFVIADIGAGHANNIQRQMFKQVSTSRKVVALTFDDGPDPLYTPQVLAILKEYGVHATFFVIGNQVVAHLDIIQCMVSDGHEVENHTYSHPNMQEQDLKTTQREIADAQTVISAATGREPIFFRPPRKRYNQQVLDVAQANGLTTALWGVCVENSRCPRPAQMAQRVLQHAQPGLIILAHDGRLDRSRTIEALPLIIQGFLQMGYQFVTLENLVNDPVIPLLRI